MNKSKKEMVSRAAFLAAVPMIFMICSMVFYNADGISGAEIKQVEDVKNEYQEGTGGTLINSTILPATSTVVAGSGTELEVNGSVLQYPDSIQLVDAAAEPFVAALYQYLQAVGKSEGVLYGHMEDTVLKAGSVKLSESDTKDMTGSVSAVIGFDCGDMFGGFAKKYNERHPGAELPDSNEGNAAAAALFANEAIGEGAIVTLSDHMPNFSASLRVDGDGSNSYDSFDFSLADSYSLTGDCMNQILPGGQYNEAFRAHLDFIADYAKQVGGPVLFRPFHENTGSWFWWGKAFCDSETYKSVFKYTVEYLRDEQEVHNLLYVYSPGSEAADAREYEERYPGDEYVDMVGFDTYDTAPVPDEEGYTFQQNFENAVRLADAFAKAHEKLFAVTETGISKAEGGGLYETGNRRPEWFTEMMEIVTKPEYDCCYFLLWSNYSRSSSYYTPFAEAVNDDGTLFGHELLDAFISFYNHEKSIFASDQADIIAGVLSGALMVPDVRPYSQVSGYMTAPPAGSRLLEGVLLTARLNQEVPAAGFCLQANGREVWLEGQMNKKQLEAWLDHPTLASLGTAAEGKIRLYAGERLLQEITVILNIPPKPEEPLLVDDFEAYEGIDTLLAAAWPVNRDGGCELGISLADDMVYSGSYSLRFAYSLTRNGWAGCEIRKETDWSTCDALRFWVKPDGKNQKTVIQINTKDGGSFEAYLQEYPEYAAATGPLLVTLPFSEFADKGGRGNLTPQRAAAVSGFGLWMNAIPDSAAIAADGRVGGVLYYDDIMAVQSGSGVPVFRETGD